MLDAVTGVPHARSVPGVHDVVIVAQPGDRVRPYVEAAAKLGYLLAGGDTAAAVRAALDEAQARLRFVVQPPLARVAGEPW